jgi:hypothetical protein
MRLLGDSFSTLALCEINIDSMQSFGGGDMFAPALYLNPLCIEMEGRKAALRLFWSNIPKQSGKLLPNPGFPRQ